MTLFCAYSPHYFFTKIAIFLAAADSGSSIFSVGHINTRRAGHVAAVGRTQLGARPMETSRLSHAALPSPNAPVLWELRGFQDDAILLINDVNYPGAPCVLSELQKWRLALNRIRDAAKAWHRYEGMWQRC